MTKPTVPGNCSAMSCRRSRIRLRSCAPFIIEALIATALGPIRYFWSRGRYTSCPIRVSVCVSRDTVERGRPQRLEISRLPSLASWPSKQRRTSNARDTTWITSPSPARSLASIPCLLSRSERLPIFYGSIPSYGIKFHLQNKLPQAICRHNKKPFTRTPVRQTVPGRTEMPDIKIVTEVAGRVCALPVTTGGNVGDGDEIAFVEAMKMEIPVTSTTAGKIKAILVKLDDVIAEGQVVAIIEA